MDVTLKQMISLHSGTSPNSPSLNQVRISWSNVSFFYRYTEIVHHEYAPHGLAGNKECYHDVCIMWVAIISCQYPCPFSTACAVFSARHSIFQVRIFLYTKIKYRLKGGLLDVEEIRVKAMKTNRCGYTWVERNLLFNREILSSVPLSSTLRKYILIV